ncbi:unnamed protein product [Euphydryas editha]|uniref:Uncharacterized protein n=1 Tax=Euphydryas editha TaxID=104508 RepID=A0AAU9V3Z7_EUPED|nr:unnamed protein product [Euphydryas editha]
MFHKSENKLKLLARAEGKIKSYDSCFDIRAWSHETENRVRYLRDWIKCDMPICVIPVSTVASSLRIMSWRHRGKVTPRCHPDCKSKMVLDSICDSCHAIKECFKDDDNFQKYFGEEEFETTHWPCERCLEALKSIKMFWKIILEKIFKVKFPRSSECNSSRYSIQNVKSIARIWKDEIVEQAVFVKNITPFINEQLSSHILTAHVKHKSDDNLSKDTIKKDNSTDTDFIIYKTYIGNRSSSSLCKKLSKCISVKMKTVDVGCGTCFLDKEENSMDKYNLDYLQQRLNLQSDELRQLKRENISLKLELRNMRKNCIPSYTPVYSDSNVFVPPRPFESYFDETETDTVKDIESEMIITMKNCQNKNFRHVSMLQVLHKTNESLMKDAFISSQRKNQEDPIEVLTKVHNTFGAIVKRELRIANKKKTMQKGKNEKDVNIAAYHKVHTDKDQKFCAKSSHSTISDSIFVSATQVL